MSYAKDQYWRARVGRDCWEIWDFLLERQKSFKFRFLMITAKLRKKHCIVIFSCVNYIECELYLNSAENEYVYRKFPNFVHCVKSLNITWKYCILISPQCKNHSTLYRRKCKHCLVPHQEVLHALSVYSPVTETILDSLMWSQTPRETWK